jgi:Flp pilus assembly protein TadD
MSIVPSAKNNPIPFSWRHAIRGIVYVLGLLTFVGTLGFGRAQMTKTSAYVVGDQAKRDKEVAYVGSRTCEPCHRTIYETYSKTSMGRSLLRVTTALTAGMVRSASIYDERSNQHFDVFEREGRLFQTQYAGAPGQEVFRDTHEIEWIIGSGANGFAGVTTNGRYLFQAPLSFYTRIGTWALSPGYEFGNYGFNRPILAGCVACHSGRTMPAVSGNGLFEDPPFQEPAIGCENCHGPGQRHVREMTGKGTVRTGHASIVNPARLPPALADNICMFCHQTGDVRVLKPNKDYRDFRPGQPLDDTLSIFLVPPKRESPAPTDHLEHYYSMILSKCYRSSSRGLSCISCHDPHTQPSRADASAYFARKCAGCHTDRSCKVPLGVRQQRNSPGDCAGCHMPKRAVGVILHSSVTSHRIMARPDEPFPEAAFHQTTSALPDLIHLSALPGQVNATPPKLTLLQAYGELMDKAPEYRARYLELLAELERSQPENALVQASLGRRALLGGKDSEAAAHLRHALEIGPLQATTYADLAEAQIKLGEQNEAITSLVKAVELDPFNAVFQKKLVLRFIETRQYAQAEAALERYVQTFPQDSFMRQMLNRANSREQPK